MPEGKVHRFELADSKVYPGYIHDWWLYVPAQYDGKAPIALMVFQDGALRWLWRDDRSRNNRSRVR